MLGALRHYHSVIEAASVIKWSAVYVCAEVRCVECLCGCAVVQCVECVCGGRCRVCVSPRVCVSVCGHAPCQCSVAVFNSEGSFRAMSVCMSSSLKG